MSILPGFHEVELAPGPLQTEMPAAELPIHTVMAVGAAPVHQDA